MLGASCLICARCLQFAHKIFGHVPMAFCGSVFTLRHAIRCHSLKDDPNDTSTVWDAAFAPIPDGDCWLATCGGDTVNFTACTTGFVKGRYRDPEGDELYCLAWTDFGPEYPVLAVAGKQGSIKMLSAVRSACYVIARGVDQPAHSLSFHRSDSTRLLSGHAGGVVALWSIGDSDSSNEVQLLRLFRVCAPHADVMAVCITDIDGILGVTGGANGTIWNLDLADVVPEDELDNPSDVVREELPSGVFSDAGGSVIDSIEAINDTFFITKAACDEELVIRKVAGPADLAEPVARLAFPHSRISFLKFDVQIQSTDSDEPTVAVAAGDHKGSVHLYDVPMDDIEDPQPFNKTPKIKAGKVLNHELSTVAIRRVRISPSGLYLVAVSDENVVFIWERTPSVDQL